MNKMTNLLMTYHNANLFASPFKMENSSFTTAESAKASNERNESIHSGHFMVSEIGESELEKNQKQQSTESDYEHEEESLISDYDIQSKNQNTQTYSVYGSKASVHIDGSLTKLFQCMNLAYNGKITSPKWKTFKGLKLPIKDKIRLNNIIWRAWHIQYIAGRNPVVCQFSSSVDSQRHKRIEAILLEGKYWKRRADAVQEEYKKWRMFHHKSGSSSTPSRQDFDWDPSSVPRWSNNLSNIDHLFSYEENADFFLTNFNVQGSFNNYYDYNSRDIARSGMGAQFMQPGLQQLQPNVDFMDTFEPFTDYFSRIEKNTFPLPTVQEEPSFDVNVNKEDDFCLFVPNNDQSTTVIESNLSKPVIESNTYQATDMFRNSNEMLNLNVKLDTGVMVQQQSHSPDGNFDARPKLDISNNFNYQNQIMVSNNQFNVIPSLHENTPNQLNATQVKGTMNIDSLYASKAFESSPTGSRMNQITSNNSNADSLQAHVDSMFMPQFQSLIPIGQSQPESQTQMNLFQPEQATLFYNETEAVDKGQEKGKYPYVPYYSTNVSTSNSINNQTEIVPKVLNHNRIRSKSITMTQVQAQALSNNLIQNQDQQTNKANITIKSLLNKPSIVSTMNQNESTFMTNNTFRVPNQNDIQMRANIERSLSLPIYSQDRQTKASIASNNQMILQRIQTSDAAQNEQNEQFDTCKNTNEPNYSLERASNTLYANSLSATTSPLSSHSSTYSLQDSQPLPQLSSNKKSKPIRKISHPEMSYTNKVLSDTQLNVSNLTGMNLGRSNNNSKIMNLFQVNSRPLSQSNVFNSHVSTSSSSSSPIGSLDNSKANNSFGLISFNQSAVQPQLNTINNCIKVDLSSKDQALDLKRNLKKTYSNNAFNFSTKDKNQFEEISSGFSTSDISNSTNSSTIGREISFKSFKSLPSGSLSSSTLSALGLPVKSEDRNQYRERRRVCHINAEQKRRCNIKNGFDTLRNLLPSLSSNVNTKISKAAMLQKAADYIRILKGEKNDQQKEYELLKQQVERLNQTISVFQNQLPATGAPITGQRSSQIKEQYVEYVHTRTLQNWKFWIFSIIMESLLDSYCNTVATSNLDEMCKTLNRWFEQNCCLITLRRDVLNSLRYISTTTNILTQPETLPEEAILAVTRGNYIKGDSKSKELQTKFSGF